MSKKSTKKAIYTTVAYIGGVSLIGTLTGFGINKRIIEQERDRQVNLHTIESTEKITPSPIPNIYKKIYQPYEHLFSIRYFIDSNHSVDCKQIIDIPQGYEIFKIEYIQDKVKYNDNKIAYDVWYTNNESVKVTGAWSDELNDYDFRSFGISLEKVQQSVVKFKK